MEINDNQIKPVKSDIYGNGYGSSHCWERRYTPQNVYSRQDKYTEYICRCGVVFRHFYDMESDIFIAILKSGIPDKCPSSRDLDSNAKK
jgi:hypothetical protein